MTKNLLNFVKDTETNVCEMAQDGTIFMVHVNAHQRTSTMEETLHHIDKMKCSVDMSHPNVSSIDVQTGHAGRDGALNRLNNIDSPSPRLT